MSVDTHSITGRWLFLLVAVYFLSPGSRAADHVICATPDYAEACKRIEGTRSDIRCLSVGDSVECLQKILKRKAHFGTFTPEEAILASRYNGDEVRVIAEVRHPTRESEDFAFKTVAVVQANFTGGLSGLRGKTYCHPGFSQGRYWSDRVLKFFESKVVDHFKAEMKWDDEPRTAKEEELYRLLKVFPKACRPGPWSASDWWDKKLKRDYSSLCAQCDFPSICLYKSQPYNEHFSALRCLTDGNGDVAYTALSHVQEYMQMVNKSEDYKLLCPDGRTVSIDKGDSCSWIRQPWAAVLSLSSTADEVRTYLQETLKDEIRFPPWKAALKKILLHGEGVLNYAKHNLKLSEYIQRGRELPKFDQSGRSLDWCTINDRERSKCEYMAFAALSFGVPVQIRCSQAGSKIDCLKKIQRNESDVTFIDTQLGFSARKVYNLTSAAFLETEKTGNYYGVVVTKGNTIKRFRDLKGKRACLPVYNGLGWLSHVQHVRHLNLVPNMLCSDSHGLWNFFSAACAPGAKSTDLNKYSDLTPNKLCLSCTPKGSDVQCDATPDNPYYSEIGALRCLNNGDGDVAILDFHTVKKHLESGSIHSDGINMEYFKILCRDETTQDFSMDDPEGCSITQLNGGEVVMRDHLPSNERHDIVQTLIEIDDLFGHSMKQFPPTFRMYEPFDGEPGVLFKDTAVALISTFDTQNDYVKNYLTLQSEMSHCYRDNSASRFYLSLLVILSALIIVFNE